MASTSDARFVLLLDIDRIFSSDEILAASATVVADVAAEASIQ